MKTESWGLMAAWVAGGAMMVAAGFALAPPPHAKTPPATIKDIMDSTVDPAGDFLFEAVEDIADERGVTHKAPHTDADWAAVRQRLDALYNAPKLITVVGRKAANPEDRSRNPDVENEPWDVQKLLDAQHPDLVRRAQRLQDAASQGLKAVDAKDSVALLAAIGQIDKACESCHLHFWYPKDKRAHQAAKEDGVIE